MLAIEGRAGPDADEGMGAQLGDRSKQTDKGW